MMKKKEIQAIRNDYENKLQDLKDETTELIRRDIDFEEKIKLLKERDTDYCSYELVIKVLDTILG